MILLLVLGLMIRRCWKDSKEMCGKIEAIAFWVLSVIDFFLMFYFFEVERRWWKLDNIVGSMAIVEKIYKRSKR